MGAVYQAPDGKVWRKGTVIFIGWPHLSQKQRRVCLGVTVVGHKGYGVFARAPEEKESAASLPAEKPLMWLILTSAVLEAILCVFVFCFYVFF